MGATGARQVPEWKDQVKLGTRTVTFLALDVVRGREAIYLTL